MNQRNMTRFLAFLLLGLLLLLPQVAFAMGEADGVDPTFYSMTSPVDPEYPVTSEYGYRENPVSGGGEGHKGMDFGAPLGAPIYAAASGVIDEAGYTNDGFGIKVVINHGGGFYTLYGHMSSTPVTAGQQVEQGNIIGYVGSTGMSTGPHLHFQVASGSCYGENGGGQSYNPREFLSGLPPSSTSGYRQMATGTKFHFDVDHDFAKPVREVIETFSKAGTQAIKILADTMNRILMILFVIDFAIGAMMHTIDGRTGGDNLFTYLILKMFLYMVLLAVLLNWSDIIGNLSKEFFTSLGGLAYDNQDSIAAQKAISNPMDIIQKGMETIAPLFNVLGSYTGLLDFGGGIVNMLLALPLAVLFMLLIFAIGIQIALVYIEFYMIILFSFPTFLFAGVKQGRDFAARGLNGVFVCSIKLFFFCFFSLMLQGIFANIEVGDLVTTSGGNSVAAGTPLPNTGINDMGDLMRHMMAKESTGNYFVDNGLGYYGAYQIDYGNYNNWEHWGDNYAAYVAEHPESGEPGISPESTDNYPNKKDPPPPAKYQWNPQNQDNIARHQMEGYYETYGTYDAVARAWNQGEGGMNNADAWAYWYAVLAIDPVSGAYSKPVVTINMKTVFKLVLVTAIFVFMGSRMAKMLNRVFGGPNGFKFTN